MAGLFAVSFLLPQERTRAQSSSTRWSAPERLSSQNGQASQGYMVSDQYGYVHVLWTEVGPDGVPSIQYSRFDGEIWSLPNDIMVSSPDATIIFLAPFVDQQGILHLMWSEANVGPVFYSSAPVYNAGTAKAWSPRVRVDASAFWGRLVVDSQGVLHFLYSDFYGEIPGIYYIKSENQGFTWSSPLWLDPDIPEGMAPTVVYFDIDENDGLHALWYYLDTVTANGTWIRYSNSKDGGKTWSLPFTIDRADESGDELRLPYPEFKVFDNQVHALWAGDSQVHREHRYSLDGGQTWSSTMRILGDLTGQALGGGLGVDSLGRLHYVTQMRYPIGIYHTYWDQNTWSIPALAYFIAGSSDESFGDRIHAHNVRLAIRAGNQLVVTFTSSPTDPQMVLYTIHRTLEDAPPGEVLPTPTPTPLPTPSPTPQIAVTEENPNVALIENTSPPPPEAYKPALGVIWGFIPVAFVLVVVLFYWVVKRRSI